MEIEMNMLLAVIVLPIGLAILIKGADLLVEGAVSVSEKFGISQLIIGLTVVAMGTSAPEVAASIEATLSDSGDMAIGNVYGSNIANLALVGGICAIIRTLKVKASMLKHQLPAMLIVALLLWPFLHNLHLGRAESFALLALFAGLILITVHFALKDARKGPQEITAVTEEKSTHTPKSIPVSILFVAIGLIGLSVGAKLTVQSASYIGTAVGLSQAVIGLTIIAIGTSLPELMTGVVAAVKGHNDLSLGNIVGSNVFNTLLVVGTAGAVKPFSVNQRLIGADYWIMIGVSAVFFLIALKFKKIGRLSGIFLLAIYAAYMVYLFALSDPSA